MKKDVILLGSIDLIFGCYVRNRCICETTKKEWNRTVIYDISDLLNKLRALCQNVLHRPDKFTKSVTNCQENARKCKDLSLTIIKSVGFDSIHSLINNLSF